MTGRDKTSYQDPGFSWKNRRRWIWSASLFCAVVISACVVIGGESEIREMAVVCAFGLLASIGGSYAFGAAWENRSRSTGGGK